MRNLKSGDRIELFYEDTPEATIRATVSRLTKSDLTDIAGLPTIRPRRDRSIGVAK
jgi:hypothetical protein